VTNRIGSLGLGLLTCLLLACTPAAPSPTTAPAKPTEAAPVKPAAPAASPAPAAPAAPAASPSPVASPVGAAPSQPSAPVTGELTVFAASSLTDAFKEIGDKFQTANPGSKVTFNFGASTQLRTQLEQGGKADLFASANQAEIDKARAAGVVEGTEKVFAGNRLALIFPKANPGKIAELKDLGRPGLKLVTAAPEVPIGVYTQDMLDKMVKDPAFGADFKEKVNANIVSREPNVRQVVAKVNLGEADGAVVYSSDVTPDVASNLGTLAIPDAYNTLATYPIAPVKNAPAPAPAEAFMTYLLGPDGQAVLKKWGFIVGS
jgi:molybdate transport system substrate-binding protein